MLQLNLYSKVTFEKKNNYYQFLETCFTLSSVYFRFKQSSLVSRLTPSGRESEIRLNVLIYSLINHKF